MAFLGLISTFLTACEAPPDDGQLIYPPDDQPVSAAPLPGENPQGASGNRFPRLTERQWVNSALQVLALPASTPVGVTEQPRAERFQFDTDLTLGSVGETALTTFRDAAEALSVLATQDDASVARLFPTSTAPAAGDLSARARVLATELLLRAFRRTASTDEVAIYAGYIQRGSGADDAAKLRSGAKLAIQIALQSPHFLARVELGDVAKVNATPVGGRVPLSGFELATRASLALFNVSPDRTLLADAQAGKLDSTDGYAQAVDKLLQDSRATDALVRFHQQLYAVDRFGQISKDPAAFPGFAPDLANAMREDMTRSITDIIANGGGLRELLTSRVGFVNARLAPTYGLAASQFGETFQKVDLPVERAGILNRAGWVAFAAGSTQRRDVIRGLYVSHNLLCETILSPKDPPKTPEAFPDNVKTNRQRMEFTTGEGSCRGCHAVMNPKGFSFEHFDAAGVFQTMDSGSAIDATGSMILDGKQVQFDGSANMLAAIANSSQAQACYAKQWTSYLLGYANSTLEAAITDSVTKAASKGHLSMRDVVRTVLLSPAFTTRKITEVAL